MKRLTSRDEYGNADIIGVDSEKLQLNLEFDELNRVTEALNLLASYEDTKFNPERLKDINTAETEGRLLILPLPKESDYAGLKVKYRVYKARNNEPVEECFVLRPEKDTAARYALMAYAGHCKNETLTNDILKWISSIINGEVFGNGKEEGRT